MAGYLVIMLIGALGCGARVWLSTFIAERYGPAFPWGTLAVNVLGCFIIGLFAAATRPEGGLLVHPIVRQAVMLGFLGGFTTFSSFALQTIALLGDGEWAYAAGNVALSVLLCLVAAWIGQTGGTLLVRG